MQKTDLEHIKKVLQHSLITSTDEQHDYRTTICLGVVERELFKRNHPDPKVTPLLGLGTNQPPYIMAEELYFRALANLSKYQFFRRRRAGRIAYIIVREVKRSHFGRRYSEEERYWQQVEDILKTVDFYKTVSNE